MIDTSMKIDKKMLYKYIYDELRICFDWYYYSDGGYILTIEYNENDNEYEIVFKTDNITYRFVITPYNEITANYIIIVYTDGCTDFSMNGCKHVFTYDEIEKFIYNCFVE